MTSLVCLGGSSRGAGAVHGAGAGPGFRYIFDGTATGSDASFDKWVFARGHGRAVRPDARAAGPGDAEHDDGRRSTSAPRRSAPTGTRSRRSATPCSASSTRSRTRRRPRRNGGVMIRSPEIRYTGANTTRDARPEADRLQLRRLPGRDRAVRSDDAGGRRPPTSGRVRRSNLPPAFEYTGGYCARQTAAGVYNVNGTQRPAADGQRQREQPPALDAGRLRPRDPDQRVADRRRPAALERPDQDGLGLRLPQPQREAVGHVQAPRQGRLARDGDPHDRPAVHGPDRRRGHQPVRQLDPEDRLPRR